MVRHAQVELRKALDTRAGLWFTISILALVLVVQVIYAFAAPDDPKDYGDFLGVAGGVLGYFMPILIIMLVTSEASQRNGLVTFTLEPRRSRVVVAKFLAGFALAVAVMVLAAADRGARHPARWARRCLPDVERRRQPAVQRLRPGQRHRRADRVRHRDPVDEHARPPSSATSSTASSCRSPSGSSARSAAASPRSLPGSSSTPPRRRCSRATSRPRARSGRRSRPPESSGWSSRSRWASHGCCGSSSSSHHELAPHGGGSHARAGSGRPRG